MTGRDVRSPLASQVRSYLDHLTVEKGASPHTLAAYRRDLERYRLFLASVGVDAMEQVPPHLVEAFRDQLSVGDPEAGSRPLAPGSVARTMAAVRGLHKFSTLDGVTATDPAAEVTPPAPPRRLPKALPVESVVAVIEAAGDPGVESDPTRIRDRAMLELLYATGARAAELVGLDVDDLRIGAGPGRAENEGTVVLRGKGGKERTVPVGGPACLAVEAYLVRARPALASRAPTARPGDAAAVFLNARGGRLTRQSLWTVLRTAARRAKVTDEVSPHTFRHSFATHLLDGGADIRVVQELLGHASVTTTQVYTLVTVETLREVWAECHPRAR